jgi:pyruvate/2-oxoglutarate dehydrogenase complex dihydrolipoamide acyltransferase (E2) component
MSTEIRIPKLGVSMEEGTLSTWLVADGASVEVGAPIYSLETDKAIQDVEAPASGKIKILCLAGQNYPVGELVGIIE